MSNYSIWVGIIILIIIMGGMIFLAIESYKPYMEELNKGNTFCTERGNGLHKVSPCDLNWSDVCITSDWC